MKIKANEPIFREWQELSDKLQSCADSIETCAAIVQNNMSIEESELMDWKTRVMDLQAYMLGLKFTTEILMNETLTHIKNCNRPKAKVQ